MALRPVAPDDSACVAGMRDTSGQDRVVNRAPQSRWIPALVVGLVVALLAAWLVKSAGVWSRADVTVPRERLRVATVTEGRFVRDVAIQGQIVAAVKPTLYAPSAGRVALRVNAGDTVAKGVVLASIDSPLLASALEQARSLLQSQRIAAEREAIVGRQQDLQNRQAVDLARVEVTAAQRELRRAESSWDYQVISRQDLEKARDELARAELEFAHKQADARLFRERQAFEERTQALGVEQQGLRVDELLRQVEALSVRSPVDGIVGNLVVDNGAAIAADAALMSVVDLSQLELEVPLAQGYADDIAVGMPASISYSGEEFPAIVSAISPEVADNTVATRLRFDGAQPPGLRQNQRLTGRIVIETIDSALMVPRGPFFNDDGGRAVYLIDGQFAVRTPIVSGATSASYVQVVSGVKAGDQLIVSSTDAFESAPEVLITD